MNKNFIFINNQKDLEHYIAEVASCNYIAIDTEFNRNNKKYLPQLCLIQICYKDDFALVIDCLANIDLQCLINVIYNPKIIKVFHSCKQDIEMLFILTKKVPTNIFDTQIAALIINLSKDISYEKLVYHFLNISLDKSLRQSSWHKRPLNNQLIEYAANDVLFLYKIYALMMDKIKEKNRITWLNNLFDDLYNPDLYSFDINNFTKKIMHNIPAIYFNKVQALVLWRENTAKSLDISRHLVFDNNDIKTLVLNNHTEKDLASFLKNLDTQKLNDIFNILQNTPLKNLNDSNDIEFNEQVKNFKILLKMLLDFCANKYSINAFLIATNEDLKDIAENNNFNNKVFFSWRYEVFGKYIKKLENGEIGITLSNNFTTVKETKNPSVL